MTCREGLFQKAYYLTGPTASGKTAVGAELARRMGAEVIALDSMTLYRGLDIGTAKPSPAERLGVPHHLIDVLDPWESASVAEYRRRALDVLESLERRGVPALFVGGTPLYLKALLRGLFEGPSAAPETRARLEAEANELGDGALHARLAAIDPITAARVHPNDRRRVIRALEVHEVTGWPLSQLQREHDQPAVGVRVVALEMPRLALHERINRRVEAMFREGLVAEVERLLADPRGLAVGPAQAVGYQEVIDHLAGRLSRAHAIDRISARTRQFAKRQETWFRGLEEVQRLPVEPSEPASALADRLGRMWERGEFGEF